MILANAHSLNFCYSAIFCKIGSICSRIFSSAAVVCFLLLYSVSTACHHRQHHCVYLTRCVGLIPSSSILFSAFFLFLITCYSSFRLTGFMHSVLSTYITYLLKSVLNFCNDRFAIIITELFIIFHRHSSHFIA